jgi:hypothetical protein
MGKLNAYVNDMKVDFGPAHIQGRLLGVKNPDVKSKFAYCTPEGLPVTQFYKDMHGNEFVAGDLHRAIKQDDGELKYIGKEAVSEAKKSDLPYNQAWLTVHTPESVELHLFPSNNQAYLLEPGFKSGKDQKGPWVGRDNPNLTPEAKEWIKWYDFLVAMVTSSNAVFLTQANIKNFEGLYRITTYQGYLAFQKQCWPEELQQFDELFTQIDPAAHKVGMKIITARLTDFDPDEYKASSSEKLAELLDGEYDPDSYVPGGIDADAEFDLLTALEGF